MGKTNAFFQTPVDKTPYWGIAGVATIALVIFIIGAYVLLQSAGWVKRHTRWLPSINLHGYLPQTSTDSTQLLNDINASIQTTADQQKQKAQDAATKAVQAEVQNQANSLKDNATQAVKDTLNQ